MLRMHAMVQPFLAYGMFRREILSIIMEQQRCQKDRHRGICAAFYLSVR